MTKIEDVSPTWSNTLITLDPDRQSVQGRMLSLACAQDGQRVSPVPTRACGGLTTADAPSGRWSGRSRRRASLTFPALSEDGRCSTSPCRPRIRTWWSP